MQCADLRRQIAPRTVFAGAAILSIALTPAATIAAPGTKAQPQFVIHNNPVDLSAPIVRVQSKTTSSQQSTGTGGRQTRSSPSLGGGGGASLKRYIYLNPRETDKISDALGGALKTCSPDFVDRRYRIDCIRFYFRQIASELPRTGEYAPVRDALTTAADKLDAIIRQNLDPNAPTIRPRLNGKSAAPRLPPIRAIRPESEARAMRAAQAVIEEAETVLLRSTENSDRRMAHYQQIAAAIDSTKVLLRST